MESSKEMNEITKCIHQMVRFSNLIITNQATDSRNHRVMKFGYNYGRLMALTDSSLDDYTKFFCSYMSMLTIRKSLHVPHMIDSIIERIPDTHMIMYGFAIGYCQEISCGSKDKWWGSVSDLIVAGRWNQVNVEIYRAAFERLSMYDTQFIWDYMNKKLKTISDKTSIKFPEHLELLDQSNASILDVLGKYKINLPIDFMQESDWITRYQTACRMMNKFNITAPSDKYINRA